MTLVKIHPDELFLAVLDAPISHGRHRAQELFYAFESCVPVDTETLQTVYHPLHDKRVLAVAISKERALELGSNVNAACPQFWPKWLDLPTQTVPPERVNLLVGSCTPVNVSRSRRFTRLAALLIVALLALLCAWGLERRTRHADSSIDFARAQISAMYQEALGPSGALNAQPPDAMLTAMLRKLRSTRSNDMDLPAIPSPADALLAKVLRAWPTDAMLRADSISISASAVEITVFADRAQDITELLVAFQQFDELDPTTSSSNQQRGETRFEIRMNRIGDVP